MARSIPAQVQVISQRKGTVLVRAKPLSGRENDARPVCGFDGAARRYAGETFLISEPSEFSPRWMDFVDRQGNVIEPPEAWKAQVAARNAQLNELITTSRTPQLDALRKQVQELSDNFSMAQLQSQDRAAKLSALEAENARLKADLDAATKPAKK